MLAGDDYQAINDKYRLKVRESDIGRNSFPPVVQGSSDFNRTVTDGLDCPGASRYLFALYY
jgi:hypothetical protein